MRIVSTVTATPLFWLRVSHSNQLIVHPLVRDYYYVATLSNSLLLAHRILNRVICRKVISSVVRFTLDHSQIGRLVIWTVLV